MKLSLISAAALASLASLALACGTTDDVPASHAPQSAEPPAVEEPSDAPPPRHLIEGRQLTTSPANLLIDPGFGLAGQQQGYGSFLAFYESSYEPFELETQIDSRSPAGFGGGVAIVKPGGATDKKSEPVMLLTSFLGGAGPFHAQVWVSKSNVKGAGVDMPADGSAVTASIADGDPERGDSFDLKPVSGTTRQAGGRTWVLLEADIMQPLAHGGFFIIRTGTKGGQVHIAAPEVTTEQIVVGQAVMSRGAIAATHSRMKTSIERAAIRKYASIPPRLVPASPKARAGL